MSELGSKEDINKVYSERNACVAMAVAMARRLGYRVGMRITIDHNWPIIFIDLPSGQVSWHVSREDFIAYFPNDMDEYGGVYDGHDTNQKYERLVRYATNSR
jgi:hypothetical protein